MASPRNPIIVIPARMTSVRLPGKPLADIHGAPMIVHVWRRAVEADLGPVLVAAAEPEIAQAVEEAGGRCVLTQPDHRSGSDRIFEAVEKADPGGAHDAVVNLQGDLPTLDPAAVRAVMGPLSGSGADADVHIGTLITEITDPGERDNPNVVKAVVGLKPGSTTGRALYFSRVAVPGGHGPLYHHIGIYAYTREALGRFVDLPPGVLEQRERLEQLRALEAGMAIGAALVDTPPLGVDTPADLERARQILVDRI